MEIHVDAFQHTQQLAFLNLSANNLRTLYRETFVNQVTFAHTKAMSIASDRV